MKVLKEKKFITACVLIAVLAVVILTAAMLKKSPEDLEDRAAAIEDTIMERALQCYVIEGAYPESLQYLQDNSGLAVNSEDYLIVYTPYADNMPPEVRVISRKEGRT